MSYYKWIFGLVVLLTSCKPNLFGMKESSEEAASSMATQAINGELSNANIYVTEQAKEFSCQGVSGKVQVETYANDRYLVRSDSTLCPGKNNFAGWVEKAQLDYQDDALSPKLTRVKENSAIKLEMNYAGSKIFCTDGVCKIKSSLYGKNRCYLRPKVAALLQSAAINLQKIDRTLSLYLYDCYRPVYVQERMFQIVANPVWVARPKPPLYGGHNRAIAIDLSISRNGIPVDMGSGFDEFTPKSNYDTPGLSSEQRANRKLLRDIMVGVGFKSYQDEWWHFFASLPDEEAFNLPL